MYRRKNLQANIYSATGVLYDVVKDIGFRGFSAQLNGGVSEAVFTANVDFATSRSWLSLGNDVQIILSDKDTAAQATSSIGGPYTTCIFRGYISLIEQDANPAGGLVNITVHVLGYYTLLDMNILRDGAQTTLYSYSSLGLTTSSGSATAADIGLMARAVIQKFQADVGHTKVFYGGDTDIPNTDTIVAYTFQQRTYREALDQLKSLAPEDVYWFVRADGRLQFRTTPTTPTHKFVFGRHFTKVHVEQSLEKVRNVVLIWDGVAAGTYRHYEDASSIAQYGRRVERVNDFSIASTAAADAAGSKFLAENASPGVKVVFTVLDNNNDEGLGYDIESVMPGDTCTLYGYSPQVPNVIPDNMIITGINYTLDSVEVTAEIVRSSLIDTQTKQGKSIMALASGGLSIPEAYA